jgi:Spy/CpxP family protein refolding chaperone
MIRGIRSNALIAGTAFLLTAALVSTVFAQGGPGPRGMRRGGGFPGLQQLNLTDAQREQVRDVMQRYRNEMQETGRRLHAAHEAQQQAVQSVPVNEGLIRSTTQALATAETDMALLQARVHNDVWTLLTPEQQAKAKELREQRAARQQQRRQRVQEKAR